jgi:hypothetical protein
MKNMPREVWVLFGIFLILASQSIAGDEKSKSADLYVAPAGSVRHCAGHVAGAASPDGKPGPHISWEAYTSAQSVEVLTKHYAKTLQSASQSSDKDCHRWKTSAEHPDQILEVCDPKFKGVWSGCDPVPASAMSLILISRIARPE